MLREGSLGSILALFPIAFGACNGGGMTGSVGGPGTGARRLSLRDPLGRAISSDAATTSNPHRLSHARRRAVADDQGRCHARAAMIEPRPAHLPYACHCNR